MAAAGATYQFTKALAFDFAYSHLFVKSTSINLTSTANPWFIPGATAAYAGDWRRTSTLSQCR